MRRTANIVIVCILTFLITNKCTDVLDQRPVTDFNEEITWQDLELAQAFLGHCY